MVVMPLLSLLPDRPMMFDQQQMRVTEVIHNEPAAITYHIPLTPSRSVQQYLLYDDGR